jgi:hypothetical protein
MHSTRASHGRPASQRRPGRSLLTQEFALVVSPLILLFARKPRAGAGRSRFGLRMRPASQTAAASNWSTTPPLETVLVVQERVAEDPSWPLRR